MNFARVKNGPMAGDLVRTSVHVRSPACIIDAVPPRNPYASGYGRKIPTRYRVRTIDQKWRRVYVVCFSNVGTSYIIENGQPVIVDLIES